MRITIVMLAVAVICLAAAIMFDGALGVMLSAISNALSLLAILRELPSARKLHRARKSREVQR